ncbi:hypothetical protein [Paenibacillus sedimenti]|uniref:Uncharacterized protein n=1 Tax=Paenibacillus sedimenti TaxID=2770274 RepID=A0A926QIM1_9BACL|nr:hypothetical protein [Paenibacillus sedimenti]MBD0379659.1 hypothetical protein [Paenibacillus sedimenti]
MKKDQILFIAATILMAVHVVDYTLIVHSSLLFSLTLFVMPYIAVSIFWHKMKEKIRLSFVVIFLLLEFNQVATDTIPIFMERGLERSTLHAVLYLISIALIMIIGGRITMRLVGRRG